MILDSGASRLLSTILSKSFFFPLPIFSSHPTLHVIIVTKFSDEICLLWTQGRFLFKEISWQWSGVVVMTSTCIYLFDKLSSCDVYPFAQSWPSSYDDNSTESVKMPLFCQFCKRLGLHAWHGQTQCWNALELSRKMMQWQGVGMQIWCRNFLSPVYCLELDQHCVYNA